MVRKRIIRVQRYEKNRTCASARAIFMKIQKLRLQALRYEA